MIKRKKIALSFPDTINTIYQESLSPNKIKHWKSLSITTTHKNTSPLSKFLTHLSKKIEQAIGIRSTILVKGSQVMTCLGKFDYTPKDFDVVLLISTFGNPQLSTSVNKNPYYLSDQVIQALSHYPHIKVNPNNGTTIFLHSYPTHTQNSSTTPIDISIQVTTLSFEQYLQRLPLDSIATSSRLCLTTTPKQLIYFNPKSVVIAFCQLKILARHPTNSGFDIFRYLKLTSYGFTPLDPSLKDKLIQKLLQDLSNKNASQKTLQHAQKVIYAITKQNNPDNLKKLHHVLVQCRSCTTTPEQYHVLTTLIEKIPQEFQTPYQAPTFSQQLQSLQKAIDILEKLETHSPTGFQEGLTLFAQEFLACTISEVTCTTIHNRVTTYLLKPRSQKHLLESTLCAIRINTLFKIPLFLKKLTLFTDRKSHLDQLIASSTIKELLESHRKSIQCLFLRELQQWSTASSNTPTEYIYHYLDPLGKHQQSTAVIVIKKVLRKFDIPFELPSISSQSNYDIPTHTSPYHSDNKKPLRKPFKETEKKTTSTTVGNKKKMPSRPSSQQTHQNINTVPKSLNIWSEDILEIPIFELSQQVQLSRIHPPKYLDSFSSVSKSCQCHVTSLWLAMLKDSNFSKKKEKHQNKLKELLKISIHYALTKPNSPLFRYLLNNKKSLKDNKIAITYLLETTHQNYQKRKQLLSILTIAALFLSTMSIYRQNCKKDAFNLVTGCLGLLFLIKALTFKVSIQPPISPS